MLANQIPQTRYLRKTQLLCLYTIDLHPASLQILGLMVEYLDRTSSLNAMDMSCNDRFYRLGRKDTSSLSSTASSSRHAMLCLMSVLLQGDSAACIALQCIGVTSGYLRLRGRQAATCVGRGNSCRTQVW